MRVNLEQASKVKMRGPTGWEGREGSTFREAIDAGTGTPRRGSEDGTVERWFGQRGRSRWAEVAAPTLGKQAARGTSDRDIVPMKPC